MLIISMYVKICRYEHERAFEIIETNVMPVRLF